MTFANLVAEYGLVLIPPIVILLIIWYGILRNHSKNPLSRKVMAILIACTVFIIAMFPLGVLSLKFWFSTCFLVLSFLFGINKLFSNLSYKRCSAYTEGTITDVQRVDIRVKSGFVVYHTYLPIISFFVDGVEYKVELNIFSKPEEIGNTIRIRYNPNDPHEITQEQYGKGADKLISVLCVILLCIALFFIIGGITDIAILLRQ
jgi:hypothetical protein